jgi:hypothetical protein
MSQLEYLDWPLGRVRNVISMNMESFEFYQDSNSPYFYCPHILVPRIPSLGTLLEKHPADTDRVLHNPAAVAEVVSIHCWDDILLVK